ncbi:MAG: arginase [Flavobacteriales bacterium]
MSKKIKLVEITSELGAGTRGASLGVGALKTAAYNNNSLFFSRYESVEVRDYNEFLFQENKTPSAIRIEHVSKAFDEVSQSVQSVFQQNEFPFLIAGDHSTAAATIAGIHQAHPGKKLGVVWVDAHADLHSPFTSPSGNIHGMPLAIACGLDNLECKVNTVSAGVEQYWDNLKSLGGQNLETNNLVFIGVRDTEQPEDYLIAEKGIKNFKVEEVSKIGGKEIAKQSLSLLDSCDLIYVSFDVDSMDPNEVSHGTGTPVPGGIPVSTVTEILCEFAASPKLVCFEVVEINPTLDEKKNKMAETAALIIEKVATVIENR